MSVERLRRVLWRLRSTEPGKNVFTNKELKIAIMNECGTDLRTYKSNRRALIALGWIKTLGKVKIRLLNKDLTE